MREYRWQATDGTLEALRRLRASWSGYIVGAMSFTAHLTGGDTVRIEMEPVDVEGVFDAYRVTASINALPKSDVELDGDTPKDWPSGPMAPPGTFAAGDNDVVIFSGASWSEPSRAGIAAPFGPTATVAFSGHAGQVPDSAEIVCITTDSLVVASSSGEGLLVRTGLKPESVQTVTDPDTVRAFLLERGYSS